MKNIINQLFASVSLIFAVTVAALFAAQPVNAQAPPAATHPANPPKLIPMDQLGASAGKQYQGDGLSVTATPEGARLRCVFQRLGGRVTSEGLWLRSTAENAPDEQFSLVAIAVGREPAEHSTPNPQLSNLPPTGTVAVAEQVVRFIRPGLTEEYTVSMDGVRQDFVMAERPAATGDLRVDLFLRGARAEGTAYGAKLTLTGSGRKLAYSRLRAVDATGRELAARLEVTAATRLAVVVDDAAAAYPVRIDPTFSDADWISLNVLPGIDGYMQQGAGGGFYAIVVDPMGNLYMGGVFQFAGNQLITNIAKWDGSNWSALGLGVNQTVYALALDGTNLYAGGAFWTAGGSPANRIAKWNGSNWSPLGSGISGLVNGYSPEVYSLVVSGNTLYAGGFFTNAGGVSANFIAEWNGSAWSPVGAGVNDTVVALAVSGTELYAGGFFTNAGGVTANKVAKWNGVNWSALGTGIGGTSFARSSPYVHTLAFSGSTLYAGGDFTTAGGMDAINIARWNGSSWSALGSGLSGYTENGPEVYSLAVCGNDLVAAGAFSDSGGITVANIAKWNGSAWSGLGDGIWRDNSDFPSDVAEVFALAVTGTNLVAGGYFNSAGEVRADSIAKWNGSEWSAFGEGIFGWPNYSYDGGVHALALCGNDLYLGGFFTTCGKVVADSIVKWDGNGWSALGSGLSSEDPDSPHPWVNALAVDGTNLYVAGYFAKAAGVAVNNIAKWNGTAWSALGSGIANLDPTSYYEVLALAVSGTNLYAGGTFTHAGGLPVTSLAKWDGNVWAAVGSDLSDPVFSQAFVYALAASGTNLYVGGDFATAGGVTVNNIAKWNGIEWSALGSGTAGDSWPNVNALAVKGDELYVGGEFTEAGGVAAHHIAKWDGKVWSGLGAGLTFGFSHPGVDALSISGNDVYAGGEFSFTGDYEVGNIAKWDGHQWWSLGSGLGGPVRAMLADGAGHLFVGGEFLYAGARPSPFFAQANIALLGGRFANPSFPPGTAYRVTFKDGSVGQPYRIQTSSSMAAASWTDLTNFTYTSPIVITDPSPVAGPRKFYRAVTP